jgi:hypothetical protein
MKQPPPPKKKIPTDYQIKSSIEYHGWVGGWGKSNEALNLLQLGKAYNGRMNTQTKAINNGAKQPPLIDMTSQTPLSGCSLHNTSAVNLA